MSANLMRGPSMGEWLFVPEGQHDRSQARSAWNSASPKEPSRRVRYDSCRYAHRFDMAPISTRNTSGIGCARSYRTLRDGTFEGHFPRHFVPGYDHAVPPGQNTFSPG